MEISANHYLLLVTFIKLISFASVAFIIIKISKNNCFDKSMSYYKRYFILGFILTFLHITAEILKLEQSLNILLVFYFVASFILLLAVSDKHRNKFSILTFSTALLAYFLSSLYFQFTFLQNLTAQSIGAIVLYSMMLYPTFVKAKELNNIGFYILSSGFFLLIIFCLAELFYIYIENSGYAYTLAVSGANSVFILVIIGFLSQIMLSEYNVINKISLSDPLTGMNNRRGLYHLLEAIVPSSNRDKKCCSVITIDIDFFKKVNDTYGHDGGDIVLKEFSTMIKNTHRNTDISARLGGEEFIIVLPDTDKETALIIAEKLRANTEASEIVINDTVIKITSSFGVDTSCETVDIDELFRNADKALYQSKFTGRNKVIHFIDM